MCTLIAIHRRLPDVWLAVAANRDEFLDRPAEGPALRSLGGRTVLAPRDLRAGGTWLGLAGTGVFAAVTNRRCSEPDPDRRSRGLLVDDMLKSGSASEAADMLGVLSAQAYNPFNAFVADSQRAFALVYDDSPVLTELEPGVHAIGNVDPDDRGHPKVSAALEAGERAVQAPREHLLDELAAGMAEHASGEGLDGLCVHLGEYGTRSSALLALAERADESRFWWAEGSPCSTEYRDLTPLLRELSRTAGYGAGETLTRKAS